MNKKALPIYGVGPLYVSVILITTIVFIALSHFNFILGYNIKRLTFSLKLTGMILIENNYYLFVLPLFYWLFLTILMILTEEKWLYKKFGKKYEEYKKKVNRCIPIKKFLGR